MPFLLDVTDDHGTPLGGACILRDHYRFPDRQQVTIRGHVAWCHACRAFALAEHFPTPAELEHEAEEFFYAKYPEERTPYVQPIMRQVLSGMKSGMAEKYRLVLDYRPHRRSPPRCLECAGTHFVPFPEWNHWYDHPADRSRFRIECRGHIDASLHRLYDPEGLPLDRNFRRPVPYRLDLLES